MSNAWWTETEELPGITVVRFKAFMLGSVMCPQLVGMVNGLRSDGKGVIFDLEQVSSIDDSVFGCFEDFHGRHRRIYYCNAQTVVYNAMAERSITTWLTLCANKGDAVTALTLQT